MLAKVWIAHDPRAWPRPTLRNPGWMDLPLSFRPATLFCVLLAAGFLVVEVSILILTVAKSPESADRQACQPEVFCCVPSSSACLPASAIRSEYPRNTNVSIIGGWIADCRVFQRSQIFFHFGPSRRDYVDPFFFVYFLTGMSICSMTIICSAHSNLFLG